VLELVVVVEEEVPIDEELSQGLKPPSKATQAEMSESGFLSTIIVRLG
jgi:hypothetical protein